MERKLFHVKTKTLLVIAGVVWFMAGFNVARLGVLSYMQMKAFHIYDHPLSMLVFAAFGAMFFKMSRKHTARIEGYTEKTKPFWNFFDKKSYIIMACMMTFGIALRSSGIAPNEFIAVFYTGLGCALTLAGVVFLTEFFRRRSKV